LERNVITFSEVGSWRELLALAGADNLGRIAPNIAETAASLDLLEEEIVKRACMDGPWRFPSDGARVWFGRAAGRYRQRQQVRTWSYCAASPVRARTLIAGKRFLTGRRFRWISCARFSRLPSDNQGQVIQAAMEEARAHLRAKRRFVWNATHVLPRQGRGPLLRLRRLCRDSCF
jgi:hypothetical protein